MHNYKMPLRRVWHGLISLSLALSLTACAVQVPRVQLEAPPGEYYREPITVSAPKGALTNGALAQWVSDLQEALGMANADRAALSAWVDTATANSQKENTK